jgi:hypothetical protein
MSRRTRSNNRTPPEMEMEVKNPRQTEGVVDVDTIPSPEPVSPTLVEEKP